MKPKILKPELQQLAMKDPTFMFYVNAWLREDIDYETLLEQSVLQLGKEKAYLWQEHIRLMGLVASPKTVYVKINKKGDIKEVKND